MKKICVVGLGYIGIPTAVMFASKGHEVCLVSRNLKRKPKYEEIDGMTCRRVLASRFSKPLQSPFSSWLPPPFPWLWLFSWSMKSILFYVVCLLYLP